LKKTYVISMRLEEDEYAKLKKLCETVKATARWDRYVYSALIKKAANK
jgi:hypothetical protein